MVYEAAPALVSFDAERALEAIRSVAGDGVLVVAELTSREYNLLYVSDVVEERFDDLDSDIEDVGDELHRYESLDFFEQDVFDSLVPTVGSVCAFATFTDMGIITRVVGDDEGLYVSVDRDVDVSRLVDELEPIVAGE